MSVVQTNYIPSRKVIAGGVAGLTSWAILLALGYYHVPVPLEWQALLPTLIGSLISYIVPPSAKDVIRRIDDKLVAMAGKDPESAVSPVVGYAAERASGT